MTAPTISKLDPNSPDPLAAALATPISYVSPNGLSIRREFQARRHLDNAFVAHLAEMYADDAAVVPIVVGVLPQYLNAAFVLDGHHRVAAARAAGLFQVPAHVVSVPHSLALTIAMAANGRNARALSPRERKHAARVALQAIVDARRYDRQTTSGREKRSLRELADMLGGLISTRVLRNLILKHHPKLARSMFEQRPYVVPATEDDAPAHSAELVRIRSMLDEVAALTRGLPDDARFSVSSLLRAAAEAATAPLRHTDEPVDHVAPF